MFEIELIICIKVELALNSLQKFICHKTQTTTTKKKTEMGSCVDISIDKLVKSHTSKPGESYRRETLKEKLISFLITAHGNATRANYILVKINNT